MRALLAALTVMACLSGPAFVGSALAEPTQADEAAIHGTITAQLDAFRRDDAEGAFAFAAPSIQGMFGSAANFLAMVRQGYRPVYRPRSTDFTTLSDDNGEIVQLVELIGPDGLSYTARYTMEHEVDGSWRISGCQLLESRRLGA